ncbi:MAG TPA: hypothetical protein VF868_04015 [Bacteroidia bacterium]
MEIKESNALPPLGGGRSAKEIISLLETELKLKKGEAGKKNEVKTTGWAISLPGAFRRSPRSKKVFVMSQQSEASAAPGASGSAQQSLIFTNESLDFPLFMHTILLAVNPRLETRKVSAKKNEVILRGVFICGVKIRKIENDSISLIL